MNTSDFNFVFLGQAILKYQVPLEIYEIINTIYETKYPQLLSAEKQLVGKIEKEHSLFFNGEDGHRMTRHNHLPNNVLGWFEQKFRHYLEWNKIKDYGLHFNSIWVNTMFEHEYNPVHVHQGSLFTGLSSVMVLKLPESFGVEYSAPGQPQNGRLQILGSASGMFANIDYQPEIKKRVFLVVQYYMSLCIYPFNEIGMRWSLDLNIVIQCYQIVKQRAS